MDKHRVIFPCGDIELEGLLHIPSGDGPFAGVVVLHPHPLYGGDMYNNVVDVICQSLVGSSIVALRFNFRGIGMSQGRYVEGAFEHEDTKAAITYIASAEKVDPSKIGLAGYSFGAAITARTAVQDKRVMAIALISPPISFIDWDKLNVYSGPQLLVCGTEDPFGPAHKVEHVIDTSSGSKKLVAVPAADHFWWGHEEEVFDTVGSFFARKTILTP